MSEIKERIITILECNETDDTAPPYRCLPPISPRVRHCKVQRLETLLNGELTQLREENTDLRTRLKKAEVESESANRLVNSAILVIGLIHPGSESEQKLIEAWLAKTGGKEQ